METEELVSKMFIVYIFTTKSRQVYNRKQVKGLYLCKLIRNVREQMARSLVKLKEYEAQVELRHSNIFEHEKGINLAFKETYKFLPNYKLKEKIKPEIFSSCSTMLILINAFGICPSGLLSSHL